jgi:hypothetical protein
MSSIKIAEDHGAKPVKNAVLSSEPQVRILYEKRTRTFQDAVTLNDLTKLRLAPDGVIISLRHGLSLPV